ncbi:alpha/beta hydrolase [uncultured Clostridium sp.]|uniref:alpha/beta hydrolase n=1 Tax=uncultured Clostridium sp. TaxID=59620 RepID=UPI0025F5593D|nr:alpha/beta hydrolase [uncultured Clostridium sp.]
MKKKILKLYICTLSAGMIFLNLTGFQKNVYAYEVKNSSVQILADGSTQSDNSSQKDRESDLNESEFDKIYISEKNYKEGMDNTVNPYIESRKHNGYIKGTGDVNLYYEVYKVDNSKGNIVISHGYTEFLGKYDEMIYYFLNNGYNVFGIEHRGHGRSGSLGVADKSQIYVDSFDDYINDFKIFMDEIVTKENEGKPMFLFAHSMGGGIGAGFLETYPEYFYKAILNAPMLQVNTGNVPEFMARIIARIEVVLGQGGKYIMGKGPFSPAYSFSSVSTKSENRWLYVNDMVNENEDFQRGEGSYKWLDEALKFTKRVTKKENASKVQIPVLLFQSGDDTYVKPEGQNKFAEYAKDCELVRIENAKHEIYFETDDIQKEYVEKVIDFYNE